MKGLFRVLMMAFVVVVFTAVDAEAQSVDKKCNELAQRTMDGAMVRVNESGSVRSAVSSVESRSRRGEVEGYRVVIFSDNGQYAGDNARNVLDGFRKNHPHINAYMVYESPYFKVSVGDCLSMEEALILMAQLTPHYPKAFPKRENIRFEEFYDARREVRDTVVLDSLEVVVGEN
jgi:hypothetical protein